MDEEAIMPQPAQPEAPIVHKATGRQPDGTLIEVEVHHNPVEL
jgi:hypothetical protein